MPTLRKCLPPPPVASRQLGRLLAAGMRQLGLPQVITVAHACCVFFLKLPLSLPLQSSGSPPRASVASGLSPPNKLPASLAFSI